jgi:hypothetical protein
MSTGDRSFPLTTACDDLQAQLEAGDRSVRHLDEDLVVLLAALTPTDPHPATLADLQRHLSDLRQNMHEQRTALREVRAAARSLCASVARARETMKALHEENDERERTTADQRDAQTTNRERAD